jgi:hypothetical protein
MPEPTLPFALAARRLGGSISTGRPDSVTAACAGGTLTTSPCREGRGALKRGGGSARGGARTGDTADIYHWGNHCDPRCGLPPTEVWSFWLNNSEI